MTWFKHEQETKQFMVAGKAISCGNCGCTNFIRSESQLHTQGMTFFQLEWIGKSVFVLICSNCSKIEWFAKKPEAVTGA